MANHIIPKTGAQIDEAIAWAYTWKDYDLSGVVFDTTPTQNSVHGVTSGGVFNSIAILSTAVENIAQNIGYRLGGFVLLESEEELPDNPTDKTLGYLIDGDLYIWVGTGGDTASGKYQNCGAIQGPPGATSWNDIEDKPELAYLGATEETIEEAEFDPEADTVHLAAQTLSSAQQQQVRENIGAAGVNDIVGIQIVNHGTSDTGTSSSSYTIAPNKLHVWGDVSALYLSLGTGESGYVQEYMIQFTSGSTATDLNLPSTLKWINGVEPSDIEADHTYQVSIMNGIGVIGGVNDE